MRSGVVASRESVQHALSDRAASVKALLDADFTVLDTAELLALQSERERRARADAVIGRQIENATVGITANQGLFGHGSSVIIAT
ncbi:hypothetical protein [Mycolicibacterium neoaurum]|uniref:hypothetical protein n=1 Tax=Mycolicibacterium neoaurum TaxID=1795 RepID=UPI00248B23C4|nr:hypothetical protein [Mycolicibacterium neoaurum]WBP97453.1 hypothetical protein O7W24_26085 [Mycolicibacterium neoaurum]